MDKEKKEDIISKTSLKTKNDSTDLGYYFINEININNIPVPYQSCDNQGNIIHVNSSWLDLFNYNLSEVVGKRVDQFIFPQNGITFDEIIKKYKKDGFVKNLSILIKNKFGIEKNYILNGKADFGEDDKFLRSHCFLFDVSISKDVRDLLNFSHSFTYKLNQIGNLDELSEFLLNDLKELTKFSQACFYRYSEESEQFLIQSKSENSKYLRDYIPSYNKNSNFSDMVYQNKQIFSFVEDDNIDLRSLCLLPVASENKLFGLIILADEKLDLPSYEIQQEIKNCLIKVSFTIKSILIQSSIFNDKKYLMRFLDYVREAYIVIDDKRTVSYLNDYCLEMLGYSKDEVLGQSIRKIISDESINKLEDNLAEKKEKEVKVAFLTKKGREIETYSRVDAISFLEKDLYKFVISAVKTENSHSTNNFSDQDQYFKTIFDESRDLITLVKLKDINTIGTFIAVNKTAIEVSGYSKEELLQMKPSDLFHPNDNDNSTDRLKEVVRDSFSLYHRSILTKSGKKISLEVSSKLVKINEEDLIISISRDVSSKERLQAELRDSQERLEAISDASFESLFFSDKGVCIDQNLTAQEMFGYTREEAIGRHGTDWIVPDDRDKVRYAMRNGLETPYFVTALRKDGSTFPAEIQGRMYDFKGRKIRVTSLIDISERKKAERALLESQMKTVALLEANPDLCLPLL